MGVPFLVSVFVMVYNHEKYLAECLDGILMQKCNFDYNVIVGEDCSTDNSREILLQYQKKYPDKFKLLLHETNIGAQANQNAVLNSCTGKYIALCEGDDYWTDPYKLQKQVDFLEANPDYGLVHTGCVCEVDGIIQPIQSIEPITSGFVFEKLLNNVFYINTLTTCIRSELLSAWQKTIDKESINRKWKMGDYPLWLEGSLHTKFKYLSDITSFYRFLPESASHSKNKKKYYEFIKSVYSIKFYFMEREQISEDQKNIILLKYYDLLFNYSKFDKLEATKGLIYCLKNNVLSLRKIYCFLKNLS